MTLIERPAESTLAPEVVDIGEDGGKQVAYGHIEPVTFACMVVAHQGDVDDVGEQPSVAPLLGWADSPMELLADLANAVEHRWAVERTAPEVIDPEDCDLPFDSSVEPGGPYVMWSDIQPTDEGAFPVTVLDLEA